MKDFIKRVQMCDNLSRSQRKVARYILDHPDQVAMDSAKKIGDYSGTSETTVIRLCYALGYSGYNELQTEIRMSMWYSNKQKETIQEFQEASHHTDMGSDRIEAVLQEEDKYRQVNQWDAKVIQDSIEVINQAETIMVVGLRTSYAPAHWFSYALNIIRGNTFLYQGQIGDPNFLASSINNNSLIIAFSFPRYTKETLYFVDAAKEKGATVLGISDHELSPLAPMSDIFLKVVTPRPAPIKGMGILFSLLNLIVTGVMAKNGPDVEKRLDAYSQSDDYLHFFVENDKDDSHGNRQNRNF